MLTIGWYLPLRENMPVATSDILCQWRRCTEVSQFLIWFAQIFKNEQTAHTIYWSGYADSWHVFRVCQCRTSMFSAPPSSIVQVNLTAFENELGVQAPVGFWDPVGFTSDGDVATFKRRRSVELKHGRISMMATMGFLIAVVTVGARLISFRYGEEWSNLAVLWFGCCSCCQGYITPEITGKLFWA